jgi:hypothetical protein
MHTSPQSRVRHGYQHEVTPNTFDGREGLEALHSPRNNHDIYNDTSNID